MHKKGVDQRDSLTCKVSMSLSISLPSKVPSLLSSIVSIRSLMCRGGGSVCKLKNNQVQAVGLSMMLDTLINRKFARRGQIHQYD